MLALCNSCNILGFPNFTHTNCHNISNVFKAFKEPINCSLSFYTEIWNTWYLTNCCYTWPTEICLKLYLNNCLEHWLMWRIYQLIKFFLKESDRYLVWTVGPKKFRVNFIHLQVILGTWIRSLKHLKNPELIKQQENNNKKSIKHPFFKNMYFPRWL